MDLQSVLQNFRYDVLFLQEPYEENASKAPIRQEKFTKYEDTLVQAQTFLQKFLCDSGYRRLEAASWLVSALSEVGDLLEMEESSKGDLDLEGRQMFLEYLPGEPKYKGGYRHGIIVRQLLQMLIEKRPEVVGAIAAEYPIQVRAFFFEKATKPTFFSRNAWLQQVQSGLLKFALVHRNEVWDLLRWQGKSHSPVSVAANPSYFQDVDIKATIESLFKCSIFWQSKELTEITPKRIAIFQALKKFVEEIPWKEQCQNLLPLLISSDDKSSVMDIFYGLEDHLDIDLLEGENSNGRAPSPGLFIICRRMKSEAWYTYEALFLAIAMGCHGPQLLRMLREDKAAWQEWQTHVSKILKFPEPRQMHWVFRKEMGNTTFETLVNAAQVLLLQSLVARTVLETAALMDNSTSGVLQAILKKSGIQVEMANEEEEDLDAGTIKKTGGKGKKDAEKKKKKRKREKKDWLTDSCSDEDEKTGKRKKLRSSVRWKIKMGLGEAGRILSTFELLNEVGDHTLKTYAEWVELGWNPFEPDALTFDT